MITWAEGWGTSRANPGSTHLHKLWVAEGDDFQRWHLDERGFRPTAWGTDFLYDLDTPFPAAKAPQGYTLRLCRDLAEVSERARAQYGAFTNKMPFVTYIERFRTFMQTGAYAAALDVVAADPDGKIGAFCIAWPDEETRQGHFEPVGTHPDFQRKGLGTAVMLEALRLLQERGMHSASVCTPESNVGATAFYKALGFRVTNRLGTYEKAIK